MPPDRKIVSKQPDSVHERASTILTSNLALEELGAAFPDNRILGAATLDRLRHGAYRLAFEAKSQRDPKPMPHLPENRVAKNGKKPQS
ncbi:MAG: ATP-binding protein [Burkholderia sp.]